jgi:hypothetical protein
MESKPKTADLSVRAAFSLMQGAVVAMAFPILYVMVPDFVRTLPLLTLLLILPAISFATSCFINWFLQYMYCGSISATGIISAGAISPGLVALFGGIVHWLSFFRRPVTDLFEALPPGSPEDMVFSREIWGYSFYLFWAGVYSQTLASGMMAACP